MKRTLWIVGGLVLAAAVVAILWLRPFRGQENRATVVETVNQVDAHPRLKDEWQPAVVGMAVYGGGQVRTGGASSARLELLEGIVRLSADSIFTVKESVTRQGKLLTTLFLQKGRLWANLKADQPHEFAVETGNAVAAVRDTRFSVQVADGATLVSVATGQVELTAQEQSVTVATGQQATVEPDQPPSQPEPMSDEERTLWATEGEMPELAPPTPTPTVTPVPPLTPSDPFADRVVAFSQGPPGWEDFSDPSAALGPPDMTADIPPGSFVCLGIGGQITLEFVNNIAIDGPGADIWVVGDIDNNDSLIVEVSADGVDFRSFGITDERVELDLAGTGLSYARFVRISDDGSVEQGAQSAGAELDAVEALNSAAPEEIEHVPAVTLGQVDVRCGLSGPAGDPASRSPETVMEIRVQSSEAVQIVVETPDGDTVALPSYGDLYGWERRFHGRIQGLPQPSGTYTFIALDATGTPIPGAVASDVYIGGHEPDPPRNVRAEAVETGILVTWDPSPVIPGAFDPSRPQRLGYYQMSLSSDEIGMVYGWNHGERLPETSHLIPLRRQDFGPDDRGMALEEMEDGIYFLRLDAFSVAPEGTSGQDLECESHDPAEDIQIVIEGGQVRVERP